MKKAVWAMLAAAVLLTGCGNLFRQEYSYSEPFTYNLSGSGGDATEISNYNMLKSALLSMINSREETGAFRFSRYNGSVADDLAAACLEVRTTNPMGAYAVETLTCDTSRIVSYYTADVQITYKKTAEEIQNVVGVTGPSDLVSHLRELVTDYGEGLVFRVYSAQVDEAFLTEIVEEMQFDDPVTVVTGPAVEIAAYPAEGINRIYDLHLTYSPTPERLRTMSGRLRERVEALAAEAEQETQPALALEYAEKLCDLLADGQTGMFADTAYGALLEGGADSRGTALGYKALCDALGIPCLVVRGNVGDMAAEAHYWNIIGLEGDYYHVDVTAFAGDPAGAFLLDDDSLWGTYLWDAEAYPECRGALRYSDVAPPPPEPVPVPVEEEQGEASGEVPSGQEEQAGEPASQEPAVPDALPEPEPDGNPEQVSPAEPTPAGDPSPEPAVTPQEPEPEVQPADEPAAAEDEPTVL